MAIRFSDCHHIELRDLEFGFRGAEPKLPIDGIVTFSDCSDVTMDRCAVRGVGGFPADETVVVACVLVESPSGKAAKAGRAAVIRDCEFEVRGTGTVAGVAVRTTSSVEIMRNTMTMAAQRGWYGIDLDDDADLCLIDHNEIVTILADSRGGIRVGSGCDDVTIRDNRITGGRSYGLTYGSVNPDNVSLGGLARLTVEQNVFESMAFGGIGPLPFLAPEDSAQPITDDVTISGNRIDRCGVRPPGPITLQQAAGAAKFVLCGGIVIWAGSGIRLLDNIIMMEEPVTVSCGIILIFPAGGLAVLRNRIVSRSKEDGGRAGIRPAGGIFVFSSVAIAHRHAAVAIGNNEITSSGGPAVGVTGDGMAVVITGNTVLGLSLDRNVECAALDVQFAHNSITTQVSVANKADAQVLVRGRHITFVGNHCLCEGSPQRDHVRLEGEPASITATSNHCLELRVADPAGVSLLLRGTKGALVAVANITTHGVRLDPDDPPARVANLTSVIP
jgi:hypothetical protein